MTPVQSFVLSTFVALDDQTIEAYLSYALPLNASYSLPLMDIYIGSFTNANRTCFKFAFSSNTINGNQGACRRCLCRCC